MRKLIIILIIAISMGCAHQKPFTIMDAENQCKSYGFKQETPELSNCVMNTMNQEKIANQRRGEIMGNAFRDAGNSFKSKTSRCMIIPDHMGGFTTRCR